MLHERHIEWINARGIDPALAEKLGLSTKSDAGGNWLSVPYVERGRVVNHKYRLTREKKHRMDPGAPLCLWNHDLLLDPAVQAGDTPVIITEGEWDALSLMTCGIGNVVSVPNGASGKATDGPIDPDNDADRFSYIWRSRDLLDNVGTFILATDADEPGRMLAAELARRLGPERCKFIEYPLGVSEPLKDLNEVLLMFGASAVVELIADAKPYPVKNIFRMSDFPTPPEMPRFSTGIPGLVDHLPVVPQTLTVVTGYAGSGKTSLICGIAANLMAPRPTAPEEALEQRARRGISVSIGSFETIVKPVLQRRLRAALIGCGEYSIPVPKMPSADAVIEERLSIIAQLVDEDEEMTLEGLLELCRIAVLRDGVRLIVIDPWNEIEHKRRSDEGEHDYTSRAIRALKTFMRRYDVALWVVVHPRKPDLSGAKVRPPSLYDASGSAHWANKADYGLIISRPNKDTNIVEAHISKVRMGLPGKEGKVRLAYDWRFSEYTLADEAEAA